MTAALIILAVQLTGLILLIIADPKHVRDAERARIRSTR